ncbi:MAG TPA: alpha/beta fold hydrolase, partial [Stellaceae bacterium]
MRCLVLSLLAALLAGCISAHEPDDVLPRPRLAAVGPVTPLAAPRLDDGRLLAADGTTLPLRRWLPQGEPRAVILALHGFNDYSNAFTGPAEALAKDGIATYAYDQRGFGEAPLRGRWPGQRQLAEDLATASRLLHAQHPGIPLYLMGESMGGAVALVLLGEWAQHKSQGVPLTGAVLIGPAVRSRD